VAVWPPQRSLGKLKPAADLFNNRILGHDGIERRIEANDAPYAVHFSHGRGHRCLGTANQQNGNSENKQSFHFFSFAGRTPFRFHARIRFIPGSTEIVSKCAPNVKDNLHKPHGPGCVRNAMQIGDAA
jgi:hypothetical protein